MTSTATARFWRAAENRTTWFPTVPAGSVKGTVFETDDHVVPTYG
jgi:hypothetical protein